MLEITSSSPEETMKIGSSLGSALRAGDVIAMIGELGAGKTTLIKGICQGAGVTSLVTSPTFVLLHCYKGRIPIYHLDLYRLQGERDLNDLGIEEYLGGEGALLVEWGEKIEQWLQSRIPFLKVNLTGPGDDPQLVSIRHLTLSEAGAPFPHLLEALRALASKGPPLRSET